MKKKTINSIVRILNLALAWVVAWIVVAWLLLAVARAEEQVVPFSLDGYVISVPVVIEGPKETITRLCWLDTAATNFWVSFGLAARLGLVSADQSNLRFPPYRLPGLVVGSKRFEDFWITGWDKLGGETCLVGLDKLWGTYTTFDFKHMLITSGEWPSEYWQAQWNACSDTLDQERVVSAQYLKLCGKKCGKKQKKGKKK